MTQLLNQLLQDVDLVLYIRTAASGLHLDDLLDAS